MIELTATRGFPSTRLPLTLDGCELQAIPHVRITSLAPYPGQIDALNDALGGFPGAGAVVASESLRLVWAGRDCAFAFGEGLPDGLDALCARTDQSDGWVGLELSGKGSADLLARRLPLDLRRLAIPGAARTVLEHVPLLLIRQAQDRFELWVWRSMADSALHALAPV